MVYSKQTRYFYLKSVVNAVQDNMIFPYSYCYLSCFKCLLLFKKYFWWQLLTHIRQRHRCVYTFKYILFLGSSPKRVQKMLNFEIIFKNMYWV